MGRSTTILVTLVLLLAVACSPDGQPTASTQPGASTTSRPATSGCTTTTATPPTSWTSSTTTALVATTTTTPPTSALRPGDAGPEVLALQERLVALGYWLGTPDGTFGDTTLHAIVALQKVAGLPRDGVAGPDTLAALSAGTRPDAQSTVGRVIEIDLARQVVVIVTDGRVDRVLDTSTGRVPGTTPKGRWTIYREVDGPRYAPLGLLWRPKYFYEGVALHGFTSVPPYPASHGCVRLTYPAMDMLWADALAPIGTAIWVY